MSLKQPGRALRSQELRTLKVPEQKQDEEYYGYGNGKEPREYSEEFLPWGSFAFFDLLLALNPEQFLSARNGPPLERGDEENPGDKCNKRATSPGHAQYHRRDGQSDPCPYFPLCRLFDFSQILFRFQARLKPLCIQIGFKRDLGGWNFLTGAESCWCQGIQFDRQRPQRSRSPLNMVHHAWSFVLCKINAIRVIQ